LDKIHAAMPERRKKISKARNRSKSESFETEATSTAGADVEGRGEEKRPLVVDLDGTLIASDLLIETALYHLKRRPVAFIGTLRSFRNGKAALKHGFASAEIDLEALPYRPEVLALIRQAREDGREVYLASASNARLVHAIADHLGLFSGWFASNESNNLSGKRKAAQLVEAFGAGGFDYVGNDAADIPVWEQAGKVITVDMPARVGRRLRRQAIASEPLTSATFNWRTWARMLRVHHYAKNLLVFVPALAAHLITLQAFVQASAAFLAFSLAASAAYILNDLMDLQEDRVHRTKRNRPLASGAIPLVQGLIASSLLLMIALLVGAALSLPFLGVLVSYFLITMAYSLFLKRKMLVDIITLAGLYTIRVIGGAVAVNVAVSNWLLAFSIMMFASLALIKRYVEVAARQDANLPDPPGRNYKAADLNIIAALAAASGFNAVTIFALYISSATVSAQYSHPGFLWLVGPLLMYWIARALMMAGRRLMSDDPLVFALVDRVSLLTISVILLLIVAAV
jgi:4-hydroxybenzoate polyprenyltransferase/phosphoserine phosphatase